jgi:prevent-host-death family protein
MLDISRDIHSLSEFKRKTPAFIEQLEETGEPVILTVNGRAKLIVQDAESYQRLRALVERAEAIEAIREGLDAVAQGKTMTLERFDAEMVTKLQTPKTS